MIALLAGCSSFGSRPAAKAKRDTPPPPTPSTGGGYYKNDGPGANPPPNLAGIPDAVPRAEPPHRYANDTYSVLGETYTPLPPDSAYKSRGLASWYGRRYHGQPTSSGEIYDMYAMTAAHTTLPIPSYARVTNPANGKSVVVRVNDRGPFHEDRIIDLSYTAAWKLDLLKGVSLVEVERIFPDGAGQSSTQTATAPTTATPASPVAPSTPPPGISATSLAPLPAAAPARPNAPPMAPIATRPVLAEPAAKPTPPIPAGANIYLQLGAFSSGASAEALISRLNDQTGLSLPGLHKQTGNGLIKVQVGPYASLASAEAAARALEQALGIRPSRLTR